ncbi:MAG: WYL domain-containing protein [Holophagaceae bacterium]|nr:WYL domain-containing protein [Holophagaceae bacterium]
MQSVLQAVKEGKAIELIFRDAEADPPRTFEPRQLIFDTLTQAWFVWGWDRRYNAERHHRLDHLAEINLVDGPGRSAQGPYKEGTPANLIGGWLGGEPIRVKATLQKQWIFAVKQAPPAFPEFKIEDGEDGRATVSFVATDLRAIARWCLQFGEGIQVLEPQRLVDRIKQVGVAWAGKPVAAALPPAPRPAPPPAPRPEHKPEHKSEHRRDYAKEREDSPKKGPRVEIRVEKL